MSYENVQDMILRETKSGYPVTHWHDISFTKKKKHQKTLSTGKMKWS